MATKTVMNISVLLGHQPAGRHSNAKATAATGRRNDCIVLGYDASHGHGHGHEHHGATEEKILLDAPRNIPVPSSPQGKRNTSLAASLLVTSVSGPSSGFDVSHGHGHAHGATEEKVLLDAPRNIPVPSSPQGKRNTSLAASLLVTSVSGPSSGEIAKTPSSTEEKVLLDAPNIPVPSSPPLRGK